MNRGSSVVLDKRKADAEGSIRSTTFTFVAKNQTAYGDVSFQLYRGTRAPKQAANVRVEIKQMLQWKPAFI